MLEDLRIARSAFEQGHPGIYRFTSKLQLDAIFDHAAQQLNQPMTGVRILLGLCSANLLRVVKKPPVPCITRHWRLYFKFTEKNLLAHRAFHNASVIGQCWRSNAGELKLDGGRRACAQSSNYLVRTAGRQCEAGGSVTVCQGKSCCQVIQSKSDIA